VPPGDRARPTPFFSKSHFETHHPPIVKPATYEEGEAEFRNTISKKSPRTFGRNRGAAHRGTGAILVHFRMGSLSCVRYFGSRHRGWADNALVD
jgi:hypothetical protein